VLRNDPSRTIRPRFAAARLVIKHSGSQTKVAMMSGVIMGEHGSDEQISGEK
jgi:hypothetical protein